VSDVLTATGRRKRKDSGQKRERGKVGGLKVQLCTYICPGQYSGIYSVATGRGSMSTLLPIRHSNTHVGWNHQQLLKLRACIGN
jgi:hypothetical protein